MVEVRVRDRHVFRSGLLGDIKYPVHQRAILSFRSLGAFVRIEEVALERARVRSGSNQAVFVPYGLLFERRVHAIGDID